MVSIAVCDDDREYINDVERHISQYFAENGLSYSLFTTQNGNELVESDTEFDIAFLDIEMPQIDGINLGKQLLKKKSRHSFDLHNRLQSLFGRGNGFGRGAIF